jgi:hypothetical protein
VKKKLIKPIKILKKSISFGKKPSQTGKKPSQTEKIEPKRFELVFVLKNRTEPKPVGLTWFRFFLKKI